MSPILNRKYHQERTAATSFHQRDIDILSTNFSFDNSKYKVSIKDMAHSSKKTCCDEFHDERFGEPHVPKFDAKTDKPMVFKVPKDEGPRDFLS